MLAQPANDYSRFYGLFVEHLALQINSVIDQLRLFWSFNLLVASRLRTSINLTTPKKIDDSLRHHDQTLLH